MKIHVDPEGYVVFDGTRTRCALGRGNIRADKREGDGATPVGEHVLGRVFYRPDRVGRPQTGLETVPLSRDMGWCDDPAHADYNRLIRLPHPARHEKLWREDPIYDLIVELRYNADPVRPGAGSAIFLHVAKPDMSPTEGCIAMNINELLFLLRKCNNGDAVVVPVAGNV